MAPPGRFPSTADAVSPGWLTEVLRRADVLDGESRVAEVRLEALGAGFGQTSDATRLHLTFAGPAPAAPSSLVGKFATTDAARRAASVSANLYANEVGFYRELSSRVTTTVPHCYFVDADERNELFVLLLEDFPDHRPGDETVGASLAEAELAVSQMAGLHGPYWGRAANSGCRPWTMLPMERVAAAWPVMVEGFGDLLPAPILAMRDRFLASIPVLHESMGREPCTLVHGDFRLDNLLFSTDSTSAEPVVVLDWQAVHTGKGMRDFAYFVAHSVATEDRRSGEEQLLRSYIDQLAGFGVSYPFDEAWHDYRLSMLYLFSIVLWITGVNVNANERALRRKRALVQRASAALLDADALALLPSL